MIGTNKKPVSNIPIVLLFILGSFHVLRNLVPIYPYVFELLAVFALTIYLFNGSLVLNKLTSWVIAYWLIAMVLSVLNWFFNPVISEAPDLGLMRFTFILPLLIIVLSAKNPNIYNPLLKGGLFCGIVAALSIIYQYIFGEISWLAEPGERAGMVRFASTLGSLTAYGGVVGSFIIIAGTNTKNSLLKYVTISILIVGSLLSLQKSSLAITVLALLFLIYKKHITIWYLLVILLVGSLFTISPLYSVENILSYINNFFGTGDAESYSDVTVYQSMYDRFTDLPFEIFHHYDLFYILIGLGFYGGSGSLGYPELPHPHNLVFESIYIWGIIWGILLVIYLFITMKKSIKYLVSEESEKYIPASIILSVFLPAVFTGGLFYFPITSILFFSSLRFMLNKD